MSLKYEHGIGAGRGGRGSAEKKRGGCRGGTRRALGLAGHQWEGLREARKGSWGPVAH